MLRWLPFPPALLVAFALVAGATHDTGCVVTSADPATVNTVPNPITGRPYYVEERNAPFPLNVVTIPGTGFFGDGTWVYEEQNGLEGMQRGWCGGFASAAQARAGCLTEPCFPSDELCLIVDADPIRDEVCGHGFDRLVY